MAETRKNGQFVETAFFDNTGGLNISDSPFKVRDTQSTGGSNFEYTQTGGIQKRRGHQVINSTPDTELRSRGLEIYNTTLGAKTVIRSADRKIQAVDTDALTFANLTQDTTAAGSDAFPASTSVTTAFAQFNSATRSLLNFAGGTDGVYAVYSPTKYTKNGSTTPSGTVTGQASLTGGSFTTSGTFTYAVSYVKASTSAESNASCDVAVTIANTTDKVTLTFSALTTIDTTTYTAMKLYRSAVTTSSAGSLGFTTGDLVATLTLPVTSYVDTGTTGLATQTVPRSNSTVLDNSPLPAGTYGALTAWKRRLVTATGTVLRISDLNAPESWPTVNTITIPSGGPITALAVISFNTDYGNDEYLAVFKDRELWLVKGDDFTDWSLSFVDAVGCPAESLITFANGFLTWVDYRGIYLWDGSGKPIYASKAIEPYFAIDGDLDKTQLQYGWCQYFRNRNMVYWFLSSKVNGEQALAIKMDLRLTLPGVETSLQGRVLDGIFVTDTCTAVPVHAAKAYLPTASQDEIMLVGDRSGHVYLAYQQFSDNGTGINWQYDTPFHTVGTPNLAKRFHKVVLWVDAVGDWDVTLDYWAGFRAALSQKSTLSAPITTQSQGTTALWDVASWDLAYWDDYTQNLVPIVFNLNNDGGNSEGDCIRLRFRNSGVDEPVTVYGYSVFWTEKAMSR